MISDPLAAPNARTIQSARWTALAYVAAILALVSDGWSGKPSLLSHQLLLLPVTIAFFFGAWWLLRLDPGKAAGQGADLPHRWWGLLAVFELLGLVMIAAEIPHFHRFGYTLPRLTACVAYAIAVAFWAGWLRAREGSRLFLAVLSTYMAGMLVAIRGFPLNYLRSDMLPVITWADDRLLAHNNPYLTIHVGSRLYDFPYLPGMLVGFLPARWFHLDPRWASMAYLAASASIAFVLAKQSRKTEVAASLGMFLLCPFLQYRHDLYLEPHWFTVVLAVALMQRRRFALSAIAWGVSCSIYQLSWVIAPLFILNAFRRRGWVEAGKLTLLAILGALAVAGPFLRSASHQVANNTVGQWSRLPHALADPINLSYWLTFVIRPDQLKWVQAVAMVSIFTFCAIRNRCRDLPDTLRWMCWALAIFIPLNVIVDGYFYLTLLLLMVLFVCCANEWWAEPSSARVVAAA